MCDSKDTSVLLDLEDNLVRKYMPLIKSRASKHYSVSGDYSDLIQEAAIGFMNAIRSFSSLKNISFEHYAKICIDNKLITYIKQSNAKKHIVLNTYISLEKPLLDTKITNPETIVISKEEHEQIVETLVAKLSKLEANVFSLYILGHSYKEMAKLLNIGEKSIENAISRIKLKTNQSLTRN